MTYFIFNLFTFVLPSFSFLLNPYHFVFLSVLVDHGVHFTSHWPPWGPSLEREGERGRYAPRWGLPHPRPLWYPHPLICQYVPRAHPPQQPPDKDWGLQ